MALLWKDFMLLKFSNFSINHIHSLVNIDYGEDNRDYEYVVTGVYGHPEHNCRPNV